MLGVIAGTGFYSLGRKIRTRKIKTKFGVASVDIVSVAGKKMAFIPRHGKSHTIAPHKINYRANIAALEKLGVTGVLAFYASGIISKYKPGDLVLLDDFIGLWNSDTLFDDFSGGMKHVDFTEPFSKDMKKILEEAASAEKIKLSKGGIIAATVGPRFETKAEVRYLKTMGANLVNMTCGKELALLGESEIDCAAIATATNYAAGISKKKISEEDVLEGMVKAKGKLLSLIQRFVKEVV